MVARRVVRVPGRGAGRTFWADVGRRWRGSLQTRVVGTTLVASTLVVGLLATLLIGQVGKGLLDTKTQTSLSEAQSGALQVQSRLAAIPDLSVPQAVDDVLKSSFRELDTRGAVGGLYTVLEIPSAPDKAARVSETASPDDLPQRLADKLRPNGGALYTYGPVPDGLGGRVDGLIVGSVITTPNFDSYDLVHLFPLTAEEQTLSLVRRTSLIAGVMLVGLLALIALLVVRQVVAPVRRAAATAALLAQGRLTERLTVRGTDELAQLGASFNTMAQALQEQIRQLEDLSRVQRRFVSDVSHELRTPLTTVRMAADLLYDARDDFPPDTRRSAELLQNELNRFEGLLTDLLEISRFDAGATSLEAEMQDVTALVRRTVEAATVLAEWRGSEVVVRAPDVPVVAEVDAVRVERVLRNLIVNALEHGEGRPVEIAVAGDERAVAVLVRDHGIGLKPGEAERVFTRFWRGDPSRARTTGGTGLGLAIALEDARLHRGRLEAWGRPGHGAAFRLTLPRRSGADLGEGAPLPLGPQLVADLSRADR